MSSLQAVLTVLPQRSASEAEYESATPVPLPAGGLAPMLCQYGESLGKLVFSVGQCESSRG